MKIQQLIATATASGETPHAVFAPLHYEPNYAYPLVIWLHGPGDDEYQLRRVMPEISMRNYVGAGPRGVSESDPGYTWGEDALHQAEESVFSCVEQIRERFHIATHRIFIAGFQAGGTMAIRLGLLHPFVFAGALSVGGPFPLGLSPLAQLDAARGIPLFVAQGRSSLLYPVERTCEELRLFHAAGLSVSVRQYPCGDELTTQMLHDMDAWLMERVTGIPAAEGDSSAADFDVLN